MFSRLGRLVVHRRRLILALTCVFVVVAAVAGTNVFERLGRRGFDDPAAESSRAGRFLEEELHAGDPDVVLLVDAGEAGVDAPEVVAAGEELTEAVAAEDAVASAVSYWSLGGAAPLRDEAGTAAIVLVDLIGTEREVADAAAALTDAYTGPRGPLDVGVGGREAVAAAITEQVESDLARAEAIAVPATLVLLVLVFGGLLAAGLPLAVSLVAMIGTFLALYLVTAVTDVSIFAINLTTALGLGLAIDYCLFIVNRFREERRAGHTTEDALVRTMETAGRTVAFSALTVAASLAALLVFPLYFLRSFAYAGTAVVVLAAAASLLTLPALLACVGHRIDAGPSARRRRERAPDEGAWHRLATTVMRRPVPVAAGVVALLLVLAVPFLGVDWGLPGYQALPESSDVRQASERLTRDFVGNRGEQFSIVIPHAGGEADAAALEQFRAEVEGLDGVASATLQTAEAGSWITVVPDVVLRSAAGEALVRDIRALDTPAGAGVAGAAAELVDSKDAIFGRLPAALAIIGLVTFVLLFAVFGSLLVPLKAVVLNLLSLTATFGAMVWVFQDGHLSGLLGFTATGQLDVAVPILTFCIAFGLSMDYEVFLLSRIKEEHDRTGDNTQAVAVGLERTGRIVTAAAGVLAVTFLAVGTSEVTFIKMFGLGMALAVVMDATVIRGLLVPAFMRLAGEANWWAPAPLRRLHRRWGLHEATHTPGAGAVETDGRGDIMATTHQNPENHSARNGPAAVPQIVDRETWQAARDELLVREKAHTREGDAIAAARRRLPMTEVDATITVVGPDGPRTLLDLFEGREELMVYRHMWFAGEAFERQCEGCTLTYWATQNPAYLHARGVSFAVFAQAPYSELAPFIEFMGYPHHWHSTVDVEDDLVRGDEYGAWTCWLRRDDRVFLTYATTGRGLEVSMVPLHLLDMTARGRREAWQDDPGGWPEGEQPAWFWRTDEDGVASGWPGGRPTVQWTRPGATPVAVPGT